MTKIKVTIGIHTLGELVSDYNRHTKAPLRAVVDAVNNREWCIELVGHTGETEKLTTGKQLAAVMKRLSLQSRDKMVRKTTSQK